jgi:hypothetical protein
MRRRTISNGGRLVTKILPSGSDHRLFNASALIRKIYWMDKAPVPCLPYYCGMAPNQSLKYQQVHDLPTGSQSSQAASIGRPPSVPETGQSNEEWVVRQDKHYVAVRI